jgi:hypothetical protein
MAHGMANDQRTRENEPPTPGDNRRGGDPDGNKTAGNAKAKGPQEPGLPSTSKGGAAK